MSEKKELKAFSHGGYIFTETEKNNQFYFYRQDGQKLGEVGSLPMDMYQSYMRMKMFESKSVEIVMNNIRFDTSSDDKCIRLTTFAIGEKDPIEAVEESKGLKKLVKSLFGKPQK